MAADGNAERSSTSTTAEIELCQQQLVSSAQHQAHEREQEMLRDGLEHSV